MSTHWISELPSICWVFRYPLRSTRARIGAPSSYSLARRCLATLSSASGASVRSWKTGLEGFSERMERWKNFIAHEWYARERADPSWAKRDSRCTLRSALRTEWGFPFGFHALSDAVASHASLRKRSERTHELARRCLATLSFASEASVFASDAKL